MMTTPDFSLEAQFELGVLFATVKASTITDSLGAQVVGAHVDLDGTVLADTGLVALPDDLDTMERKRRVRQVAIRAIARAHAEIGLEFDTDARFAALAAVAVALPLIDSDFEVAS